MDELSLESVLQAESVAASERESAEVAQLRADLELNAGRLQELEQQVASSAEAMREAVAAYLALAKELPEVIPEVISGESLAEVQANLAVSRAAYVESVKANPVSVGGGNRGKSGELTLPNAERGLSLILQGVQQGRAGLFN